MNAPAMAVTPHVMLRRLVARMYLLAGNRGPNERPELTWPAFIEAKLENPLHITTPKAPKCQNEGDQFAVMMTVSVGKMEPMRRKSGEPELDKDGAQRHMWVTRDEQHLEPLSSYGSFIRWVGGQCGLKPKALGRWTEDEVMRMASEVARFVERGEKAGDRQATDHPNYPRGWQDAQAVAMAHGEEQGFWRESE